MPIKIYQQKTTPSRLYLILSGFVLFTTAFVRMPHPGIDKLQEGRYSLIDTMYISPAMLYQTLLTDTGGDTVVLIASSSDNNNIPRYRIAGRLFSQNKHFSFSITDSLLLNYEPWSISSTNNIRSSPEGLLVTDFVMSRDSASISAITQQNSPNNPVDIIFQNFNIRHLATAFNKDTLFGAGLMTGTVTISEFKRKLPAMIAELDITGLTLMQSLLGNLHISAAKQNDSSIHASVRINGIYNDITGTANYYPDRGNNQLDAVVDLKKLSMSVLQAFSKGYITRGSGSVSGQIALNGEINQPRWKGSLRFDTAKFSIAQFGNDYTIRGQQATFDYPDICFDQFTVRDTLDNPMTINGKLQQLPKNGYELALGVQARDFNLVNAPKAINNQAYGAAVIDADVTITGNSKSPDIKGAINLDKGSAVTMVLPEKSSDKDAAGSLVRFIDKDTFSFTKSGIVQPPLRTVAGNIGFRNRDLTLRVDKEASLTIVIDPSAGDELKLQGVAQLVAGVDTANNVLFDGIYKLDKGYYELNYEFAKKRFNLLDGSLVQFAGGANDAEINIRAVYIANTSPNELLGNEVGTVDPRIARSFKQKIPFRVILYLKGSLMKPFIRFDIQLADEASISNRLRTTINNKLIQLRADTAATNKQVFALLALDRFVGEQSTDFFKGQGGSFNELASESVSRFLSDALDQIASDLFKGINIDLNLNSYKDFATNNEEQKKDLNVEVSKSFLNDRLNVTVGKNFGIEGQDGSAKASKQKGSRFLPDVTTNYKLSKDGKYMLRGYSKNQLEVILDGYVVETGVGFLVTMDYDKFSELLVGKKKTDQ